MAKVPFLPHRFRFEGWRTVERAGGVTSKAWVALHECRAAMVYSRGSEVIEAARLDGRSVFKIRLRNCSAVWSIDTNCRAIDVRLSSVWDIKEIDYLSDRSWAYIVIEGRKPA